MKRSFGSSSRDESSSRGSCERLESTSRRANPFAMDPSGHRKKLLSLGLEGRQVERHGRVISVDSQPAIILDSDSENASGSSQNYRGEADARLSVDGRSCTTSTKIYPSFLEETKETSQQSPRHHVSKRSAQEKAKKRITKSLQPDLPSRSVSSHCSTFESVHTLPDQSTLWGSNEKKSNTKLKPESVMYSKVSGCKVSQTVRKESGRERQDFQVDSKKERANVRLRPVMSDEADSDNGSFDPCQSARPSERAKRYEDKPVHFSPQNSVEAITNVTPRPPIRCHSSSSGSTPNTKTFYGTPSPATLDSTSSRVSMTEPPSRRRNRRLRPKRQPGSDAGKGKRNLKVESGKPECIVLDSGDEHSEQADTVKEPQHSAEAKPKEELADCKDQELPEKKREIDEDTRLKLIESFLCADRPNVKLPVKTLMVGTLQLEVVSPALLRPDIISFQYIKPHDHGKQDSRIRIERCLTIDTRDITDIKSNLCLVEPCPVVLALQTRGATTSKLQASLASLGLKDRGCCYNPKSSVFAEKYIVLILGKSLTDASFCFLQHTVNKATKTAVLWQELSNYEMEEFLSGARCGEQVETETTEQTALNGQLFNHTAEPKKQYKTRSATKSGKTRLSLALDKCQSDGDEEELPSFDSIEIPEEPVRTVLRYKSSCTYGASGITVTTSDLSLLRPNCWLNDNLINFYLMYLYDSVLTDDQRERTYVYSTFLLQKLGEMAKKQRRQRSGSVSIEEDRKQLRRWTKDVDLLSKDFLVIPVNQSNVHWYLIVVCYAHLALTPNNQSTPKPSPNCLSDTSRHPILETPEDEKVAHEGTDSNTDGNKILTNSCNSATIESLNTGLDGTGSTEEDVQPSVYFRNLAESPLDMSCSDNVVLFEVPSFESNSDGKNQCDSESDRQTLCEKSRECAKTWSTLTTGTEGEPPGIDAHSDEASREGNLPSLAQESAEDSDEAAFSRRLSSSRKRLRSPNDKGQPSKVRMSERLEQKPCILVFDSLKSSGRKSIPAKQIRDYLTCEYRSQQPGSEFEFDVKNLPAEYPKVPSQPNSCDCGVFVCQFTESFFKNPITNYQPPILLIDWFSSEFVVSHKRQQFRDLIEELDRNHCRDSQPRETDKHCSTRDT